MVLESKALNAGLRRHPHPCPFGRGLSGVEEDGLEQSRFRRDLCLVISISPAEQLMNEFVVLQTLCRAIIAALACRAHTCSFAVAHAAEASRRSRDFIHDDVVSQVSIWCKIEVRKKDERLGMLEQTYASGLRTEGK